MWTLRASQGHAFCPCMGRQAPRADAILWCRGELTQSKLWSGRLCQELRGYGAARWAWRLCGDSRARGASGACGFWGEHMHVFGTFARAGPHAAGHIHDPLPLVSTRMSQHPKFKRPKCTPTAYTGPTSCLRCDKQFQSWDRRQNRLCGVCLQTIAEQPSDDPTYSIAPWRHASRASDDS